MRCVVDLQVVVGPVLLPKRYVIGEKRNQASPGLMATGSNCWGSNDSRLSGDDRVQLRVNWTEQSILHAPIHPRHIPLNERTDVRADFLTMWATTTAELFSWHRALLLWVCFWARGGTKRQRPLIIRSWDRVLCVAVSIDDRQMTSPWTTQGVDSFSVWFAPWVRLWVSHDTPLNRGLAVATPTPRTSRDCYSVS